MMNIRELSLMLLAAVACLGSARAQEPILWWEQSPVAGATGFAVALGDVDGDGHLDVIWIHNEDPGFVFLNDGAGAFALHPTAPTLPQAGAVALGDLNGNGHLDLFRGGLNGPLQVYTNDGSGAFFSHGGLFGPNHTKRGLALVDVNGNGYLDAVVPSDSGGHTNELWLNDGTGFFVNSGQDLGDWPTRGVAVGDLNGNGFPDLMLAVNGFNRVFTNNGSGVFTDMGMNMGTLVSTYDIALADLNGNGFLDAFVANGSIVGLPNEVWFNDGTGVFTNSGQALGNAFSFSVILADVTGDGAIDAVVGNNAAEPNEIWINDGTGFFTLHPEAPGFANVIDMAAGDLNGNGALDFFFMVNANPSEVWRNVPLADGGPLVDSGIRVGGSAVGAVASGDFNGDGLRDLALGTRGGLVYLYFNQGNGQFAPSPQVLEHGRGVTVGALAAGDMNNNGSTDLLVGLSPITGAPDNLGNRLWTNNGTGSFSVANVQTNGRSTGALALVDLNGNGRLDILEGNSGGIPGFTNSQNRVIINQPGGTFATFDALGGGNTRCFAVGDLNGNGFPDVLIGYGDQPVTVWFHNQTNQLVDSGQSLGAAPVENIALADFTGNGYIDALFAKGSGGSQLWTNNGSGVFSQAAQSFGTFGATDVAVFDANGNGHMDFWLGNGLVIEQADQIWTNDGTGFFTVAFTSDLRQTRAVVIDDFTGNGQLDIFAASSRGNSVLWAWPAMGVVEQYAASFGLSGPDILPFADPDEDGVPNVLEYAFNMNPAFPDAAYISDLASATGGLPRITVTVSNDQPKFVAEVIRLVDPGVIAYFLEVAPTLVFTGAVPASVSTTPLDGVYERAEYEYIVPGPTNANFGRFGIEYSP